MNLDQFYTNEDTARVCFAACRKVLSELPIRRACFFIEPSAGAGAFYTLLPKGRRIGVDLAPACPGVLRRDFLNWRYRPRFPKRAVVAVGNPPFGTRGKLAARFINHASTLADTVAFILPAVFRKYSAQSLIRPDMRLVLSEPLPPNSFILSNNKPYQLNAVFQVWTRLASAHPNLRELHPPKIRHPDFNLLQYNNTPDALKVFRQPFDFAVPCQGWQDYTRRETRAEDCEKNKQWILIRTNTPRALQILRSTIDYTALAHKNGTTVPGFRKNDVVKIYEAAL